ncbi:MAG TPA: CDP-alcohol phosphatidyltransferase family protein [Patescibacteria group bacterium]|nr:CDP-alcohol phosphatidyltransferase family protein [Patescibacteria group bacterium]
MASVYQLKSRFQGLLRPLVAGLAARGLTANQVTLAAAALSLIMGACLAAFPEQRWPWLSLPLFFFFRMALNAVDGMLAREHNQKSRLGTLLNELGDVIADTALYLPFALLPGAFGWLVALVCIFAVISEMTGIAGLQIGASRRYDGPMGKSDRALAFGTLGLAIGLGLPTGIWLNAAFAVLLLLLCRTIYNRAARALAEGTAP